MSIFLNDRALLEEFRRGSRQATELVYKTYVDDVTKLVQHGFSAGSVGRVPGIQERSERLDLIQDIFLRAFSEKARLGYDGLRPYRPYLLQIARNLIIDHVRKSGREISTDGSGAIDLDAVLARNGPLSDIEDLLHRKSQRLAALRYVDSLEPDMQEFVRLRFMEAQAQETVAKALGLSRQNVRTLEKKTLQGLVEFLQRAESAGFSDDDQPEGAAHPYVKVGGES